jgi:hypothetical protein
MIEKCVAYTMLINFYGCSKIETNISPEGDNEGAQPHYSVLEVKKQDDAMTSLVEVDHLQYWARHPYPITPLCRHSHVILERQNPIAFGNLHNGNKCPRWSRSKRQALMYFLYYLRITLVVLLKLVP